MSANAFAARLNYAALRAAYVRRLRSNGKQVERCCISWCRWLGVVIELLPPLISEELGFGDLGGSHFTLKTSINSFLQFFGE
ncbi:uncharacterized protein METZ01_LOCUS483759, partial [marine metagenome]